MKNGLVNEIKADGTTLLQNVRTIEAFEWRILFTGDLKLLKILN